MEAAVLAYIKNRLPADHGFTDDDIEDEYTAAGNNENETLARLFERIAADDTHKSVSIGGVSYSDPLYLARAEYWRQAGTTTDESSSPSTISFVPTTNLPFSLDDYYSGTELG